VRYSLTVYSFALLIVAVTLGYANAMIVDFNYLLGHVHIHLMLLMLLVFVSGSVFTALYYSARLLRAKRSYKHLQQQLFASKQELKKLRCSPLKDIAL